jgi:hypothetical protein
LCSEKCCQCLNPKSGWFFELKYQSDFRKNQS